MLRHHRVKMTACMAGGALALAGCAASPAPTPTVTVTAASTPTVSSSATPSSEPVGLPSCLRGLDSTAEGRSLIRDAASGAGVYVPLPASESECATLDDMVLLQRQLLSSLPRFRSSVGNATIDPKAEAAGLDDPLAAAMLWQERGGQLRKASSGGDVAAETAGLVSFYRSEVKKRRMSAVEADYYLRKMYVMSNSAVRDDSSPPVARQQWEVFLQPGPGAKFFFASPSLSWLKMLKTRAEYAAALKASTGS